MKWMIAISACVADCERNIPAMIDTWLRVPQQIFMGPKHLDGYDCLPFKTRRACEQLMHHDYIFHCFPDTYVRPEKLKPPDADYSGFVLDGEPYCSGGAGYWLSRKAMEIIARAGIDDTAEDRWVGKVLRENGIAPLHSRAYMPWRVPITRTNEVVSVHLSKGKGNYDPQWMREVHAEWESSPGLAGAGSTGEAAGQRTAS